MLKLAAAVLAPVALVLVASACGSGAASVQAQATSPAPPASSSAAAPSSAASPSATPSAEGSAAPAAAALPSGAAFQKLVGKGAILVCVRATVHGESLWRFAPSSGSWTRLAGLPFAVSAAELSPDRRRVALVVRKGDRGAELDVFRLSDRSLVRRPLGYGLHDVQSFAWMSPTTVVVAAAPVAAPYEQWSYRLFRLDVDSGAVTALGTRGASVEPAPHAQLVFDHFAGTYAENDGTLSEQLMLQRSPYGAPVALRSAVLLGPDVGDPWACPRLSSDGRYLAFIATGSDVGAEWTVETVPGKRITVVGGTDFQVGSGDQVGVDQTVAQRQPPEWDPRHDRVAFGAASSTPTSTPSAVFVYDAALRRRYRLLTSVLSPSGGSMQRLEGLTWTPTGRLLTMSLASPAMSYKPLNIKRARIVLVDPERPASAIALGRGLFPVWMTP
jgi:hypothetical protein